MGKSARYVYIVVLLIGAILRIWGIGFGLPYQFHQDEPIIVNHAIAYGAGDLNPHYSPPFTSHILFFFYIVYFVVGKMLGFFVNAGAFALSYFKDPTAFYLIGRLFIGVIPGVLSIIFIKKLYKNIFSSDWGSVFAAAVFSLSFVNIVNSHYIYVDTLMSMFVILSMTFIFKMRNVPNKWNYGLSAVAIGFAIGIKYNAALLIVPFLAAHLAVCKGKIINTRLIYAVALILATFFITNPFAALDHRFVIDYILRQSRVELFTGWLHHVRHSLYESLGFGLLLLGVLGLLTVLVRKFVDGLILISFPLVFYFHLVFFSQPFSRYAMPLIPFLAIGAGYIIFERILPKLKYKSARASLFIACFAIFIPLFMKSAKADMLLNSKDTRIEVAQWCDKNINSQSRIALDHTFFRPAVFQVKEQLIEKYKPKNSTLFFKDLKSKRLELMIKVQAEKKSYYLYFLNQSAGSEDPFVSAIPYIPFDLELLKDKGIEYVIINYTDRQINTEDFYRKLKNEAVLVSSFSPYVDKAIRMSYDKVETTCMPIVSKEIYSRNRSGPALEIYRLNK